MTGTESGEFDALPPSAKYVYRELAREFDGRATRADLLDATRLPESTLDDALDTLEYRDYILRSRDSEDPRCVSAEIRDSRWV